MTRRTRAELQAENLVLLRELEAIRDRLDDLLQDEEANDGDLGDDDESAADGATDVEDED